MMKTKFEEATECLNDLIKVIRCYIKVCNPYDDCENSKEWDDRTKKILNELMKIKETWNEDNYLKKRNFIISTIMTLPPEMVKGFITKFL